MKNIHISILTVIFIFCATTSMFAVKPVKNTPINEKKEVALSEQEAKKMDKLEKKLTKNMAKFEKRLAKKKAKLEAKGGDADVDFQHPTDKWMWFWIFSWGAGLAALLLGTILLPGLFGFISAALILFGFIAMVLWIVKKFS